LLDRSGPLLPTETLLITMIHRFLLLALLLVLGARAQSPLDRIHLDYQQERLRLVRANSTPKAQEELAAQFIDKLRRFLAADARGMDRFNGRLMLVDYLLSLGKRDDAVAELEKLDAEQAPALILAAAAEFASYLNLDTLREQWITAAIANPQKFEDRMALGTQLITRLLEIERGTKIFDDALAAAVDDERRATVQWHRAVATREREDVP